MWDSVAGTTCQCCRVITAVCDPAHRVRAGHGITNHCWPGVDMTGWQHSLRCRRGLWRGQEQSSCVTNSKYGINYLIVVHTAVWSCCLLVWHGADSARWHHSFTAQQGVVRSSYRCLVTGDCSDQNITTSPPSHPSLVWWQHWQLELETNLR